MAYLVYDSTGSVKKTLAMPANMVAIQLAVDEFVIEENNNVENRYIPDVNNPVVTDKLANPTTIDKMTVMGDGIDQVTLSNIPANSLLTVRNDGIETESLTVSSAHSLTFDGSGDHIITISVFPYIDYTATVMCTFSQTLSEEQADAIKDLKASTFQHVTTASGFTTELQTEYSDDWLELKDKETQMTLTQAEQDRLDHIRTVRQWKIALLANRDGVITNINAATNTTEIDSAAAAMVYIVAPSGIV